MCPWRTQNSTEALRLLGLGHKACRVYLALLVSPRSAGAISSATGLGGAEFAAAYGELADAGLASAAAGDGDVVAPVPAAAGLEILTRHRQVELEESRIAVESTFELFRRRRLAAYNDDLVEVVTG
ncbi:helix-turn-helix transcriptional regulator [Streptomyces hirsutus]